MNASKTGGMANILKHKFVVAIIKICIVGMFLKFASKDIDWEQCKNIIYSVKGIQAIVFCSLVIIFQNICGGIRLWLIAKSASINTISKAYAIKSYFVGAFFSQIFFSLSGEAMRTWYLRKKTPSLLDTTSIVLLDRIAGFIALSCLYFGSLYSLRLLVDDAKLLSGLGFIDASCFVLIAGFVFCILYVDKFRLKPFNPLQHLLVTAKQVLSFRDKAVLILATGFVINLSNVLVLYIAGTIYGISLNFTDYLIISTPAFIISTIPITVAGWGVRESAIVLGFSLMKVNSNTSMAMSLTFGLACIAASLPGLLFINHKLTDRSRHIISHILARLASKTPDNRIEEVER